MTNSMPAKGGFAFGGKKYLPLIGIMVFGALLRFYHNLDISLWHDEAFSALLIRYPWSEMMYRIGLDVHPPMYYIFLRFWHYIFGDSMLSLRGFSVFFSVGSILAGYAFVKEAFKNEKASLWAAALIALSPFQLQYVTEARMYTMGAFFALLAAYFLVKAFNAQRELAGDEKLHIPNLPAASGARRRMIWHFAGFAACMAIMIYTHYYLFFTTAAIGAYGLVYLVYHYRTNYRRYVPFLVSCFAAVLSFLPWLKTFLFQYRQVDAGYWIEPMNRWSIPSTFWDMLLGLGRDTSKHATQIWLVVVALFCLYLLYRFVRKTQSFHKWLALFAILAPFFGAGLFALLARASGSNSSVYLDRYFLFASVFFSIAAAVWLKEISPRWLAGTLFAAYAALNLGTFNHYWTSLDVASKPGMAAAAKYLIANTEPQHKIVVGTSFEFFNFKYYWSQGYRPDPTTLADAVDDHSLGSHVYNQNIRPLLYSGGQEHAADISHFAGSALLTDADLLPDLSQGAASGDTVWLVWTNGFGSSKPSVPANWTQVDEKGYAEVRPWVGTWVVVTEYKIN